MTQAMDPLGIVKKWIGESALIRQPNPGSGDCLFHSVAQGLARQDIHRTHDRLRQETVQHIQQNAAETAQAWDHHTPAAPGNSVPCSSIEEYIRLVSQRGAWACNMELLAISRIHPDHPMLTIGPRTPPTALGNRQQVLPPPCNRINLWLANGHYELVTSIVPEWVWITVWDAGQDIQEQVRTDQTLPPAREDPLGVVKLWAAQTQMHRMPTAGQGDCLFRAMAQAIERQGISMTHGRLRQDVVEFIRSHQSQLIHAWDHHTPESTLTAVPCASMETYLDLLGRQEAWAGDMELLALSMLYPRQAIMVLGPQSNPIALGNRQLPMPPYVHRVNRWLENGDDELY